MASGANSPFNFINLTILPSILGVGIDSGIYIFDHYRKKRNENFFVSMQKTSKGVILSSLTNIAAFASLSFAHHRGIASLGLLGVFGFTSCLLASVYFVPSLIEFFELRMKHLFQRTDEN
jgi:predicted RND superfamily exporter protein